jgi:Ca2+-binding RTX toxin-like protein
MTAIFFTASVTQAGTIDMMAAGDTTDVVTGVSLVSTGGDAIDDAGYGYVEVDGSVDGENGIDITGTTGQLSQVIVGTGGSVVSWDGVLGDAVFIGAGTHEITNRGEISCLGRDGFGIDTGGPGVILNYGSISSDLGIVDLDSAATDLSTVYNHGSISGTTTGYNANVGSNSDFYNYGDISAPTAFVTGDGGSFVLVNSGVVSGVVSLSNTGGDTITNRGTIDGNVQLGNGTNTFNGVGGTVTGTITGGSGADTIHLGNDGETVNGGAGHDLIYGGTGADTFAFSSFLASDYDRVVGFNVANDTIELAHADFTKLTAGATPVFSIGTKATSASDHLFYNSTTGWLSYDPDGTGPQASHGFVNLGAGLHLMASNFTVV